MQLIHAGRVAPDPGWHLPRETHAFHELIVIVQGRMRTRFDDIELVGDAGTAFLYRAGDAHAERSDPDAPVETRFMCFTADLAPGSLRQVGDRQGRLRTMATWLVDEWTSDRGTVPAIPRTLAAALIAEWGRLAASPVDPMVASVQAHIRAHLARPLGIGDLARVAGLSPFHFQRRYRALTGRTPMQELRAARIAAARQLVVAADLPLREIPSRVGLSTIQHLTRLFRDELGITPGAMRQGAMGFRVPTT